MNKPFIFLGGMFLLTTTLSAEMKSIQYEMPPCECKAEFDSRRLPTEQARDAVAFLQKLQAPDDIGLHLFCGSDGQYQVNGKLISKDKLSSTLKDMRPAIQKGYAEAIREYAAFKLPELMESNRQDTVRTLQQSQLRDDVMMEYFITDKESVLTGKILGKEIPSECDQLVQLSRLPDEKAMIAGWDKLSASYCAQETDIPSRATCVENRKNFIERMQEDHSASCDILVFQWNTCVNRVLYPEESKDQDSGIEEKIRKLFQNETCACPGAD